MSNPKEFCEKMDEWAELSIDQKGNITPDFKQAWYSVRLAIRKSCLLDRTMYHDEHPSQTPCPVHKGKWSGCDFIWPGNIWVSVTEIPEVPKAYFVTPTAQCQRWYDEGCRCAYHKCGCTTGWQPDEHCGCGGEKRLAKEIFDEYGLIYGK